jgi:hypothetical protein
MEAIFLVPTRGRPQNALRLLRAWCRYTSRSTRLCFIIDNDDPELTNYSQVFNMPEFDSFSFGWMVDERRRLGGSLNYWAPKLVDAYEAIGFMGDDHLPRDIGWDLKMKDAMVGQPTIAYGNDLIQGPNLPTAVLMDSRIVKSLGWMIPPGLTHMYLDNFWRDFGHALGTLVYLNDVIIEHVHPIAGKTAWDDRYTEVNEFMGPDGQLYAEFVSSGGFEAAATKVRKDVFA